ncbi:cob(I)yrinic acid a,c-diamide adenosyltransferase, mitochondrial-like [Anoplophora glabripennis]|uniref:cob(I)yrinic acid a,c-diamide adenosyltransferase, mitochondrial-like n=1 Tax=Anoplophora glabripennis TaxID=217634 RepID=UPI00087571DF|nr:cob(I)yrinic acid a,c-diamide adenosyltransferase, mitochondrial-like [Anoplophora glabripennis]
MVFRRLLQPRQLQLIRTYCIPKESLKQKVPENENLKDQSEKILPDSFSRLGDNGTSKTIDGTTLPKDNQIFSAIGATEELLSFLGLAKEHANESEQQYTDKLKRIQTIIIDISTAISRSNLNKCTIPATYTIELEDWIHEYSKQLPPPEQYIIPGGGMASASLHVTRSICRKTERILVPLVRQGLLDKQAQIYLNRLSDFLFTISRIAAKHDQRAETIYIPKPDEKVQAQ